MGHPVVYANKSRPKLDIITCWGTVAVAMSAAGPTTVRVPVLGKE